MSLTSQSEHKLHKNKTRERNLREESRQGDGTEGEELISERREARQNWRLQAASGCVR